MDHPPPGQLGPPSAGRDRLIWVAPPPPQRPRAAAERELLGGLDLGTMPASVTPPRTWRRAAAFSVAASAAVLMALSVVALAVVGPAQLTRPLRDDPGGAKVVVAPDAPRPGTAAGAAGATAQHHPSHAAATGPARAVDQGGHGRYGNTAGRFGPAAAAASAASTASGASASTAGEASGAGEAVPPGWPASTTAAGAGPAEPGDVTGLGGLTASSAVPESGATPSGGTESGAVQSGAGGPSGVTEVGLTPEPGGVADSGGTRPDVVGEAAETAGSATQAILDGHGILVRLASEPVREAAVAGIEVPWPGDAIGSEQSGPTSATPPVPPDEPDTAASAKSGVSHWISVDPLGKADRRS